LVYEDESRGCDDHGTYVNEKEAKLRQQIGDGVAIIDERKEYRRRLQYPNRYMNDPHQNHENKAPASVCQPIRPLQRTLRKLNYVDESVEALSGMCFCMAYIHSSHHFTSLHHSVDHLRHNCSLLHEQQGIGRMKQRRNVICIYPWDADVV
jgi:hypothetical protein